MTTTPTQENTARIKRDELLRLLNVTSPVGYQAITARTRLDEVAAELARAPEPVTELATPPAEFAAGAKRTYARPFSHVAALLPAAERPRRPRTTMPVITQRARTAPPVHSLAVPERAPRTVADVRERLDRGEDLSARPWISARVASHLTAEEIAMLPMDLRLRLPAVTAWNAPPRIELTPMPGLPCIDLHPVPAAAPVAAAAPDLSEARVVTIALAAAVALLGACAAYVAL